MKLFLAAEAKHPSAIEKLRQFVGDFAGKKILYIPTAANGESIGAANRIVAALGETMVIHT